MLESEKNVEPLYVTSPALPSLDSFMEIIQTIWSERRLTNFGELEGLLEVELTQFLAVDDLVLVNNGTSALIAALEALPRKGKVITTPFSFVATSSAIVGSGHSPLFVDIERSTMSLDPEQVEVALQMVSNIAAIVPVHCYGFPSAVDQLESIAAKFSVPVIYDGAHAFNAGCHCGNLLKHGDVTTLSFHATKVFSTGEGGAIVINSPDFGERIRKLRNFGYENSQLIDSIGFNFKLPELSAGLGLANLRRYPKDHETRESIWKLYKTLLEDNCIFELLEPPDEAVWNYAYAPVLISSTAVFPRTELLEYLGRVGIFARAYFSPLITDWSPYKPFSKIGDLRVARDLSSRILCLPLSANMRPEDASRVVAELERFVSVNPQ